MNSRFKNSDENLLIWKLDNYFSDGPRFIMDPSNVSVEIGQRAELRCVAEGNPRPEIIWRKSAQFHVLHVGPTFVIPSVGEEDFGIYICTATVLGFSEVSQDVYLTNNGIYMYTHCLNLCF